MPSLTRDQIIERAKQRSMPPVPAPRSRADAAIDGDYLYTTSEAAAILHIGESSIRTRIMDGAVNVIHIGRAVRIQRSEIARYMKHTNQAMTKEEAHKRELKLQRMRKAMSANRKGRIAGTTRPQSNTSSTPTITKENN